MTVQNKHSLAGVSAGPLTTSSVGTTDTAFNSVNGSGLFVDNSGVRAPRIRFTKVTAQPGYAEDSFSARTAGALRVMWVPPATAPPSSIAIITVRNGGSPCFKINLLVASRLVRILDTNNAQIGSTGTNTYDWDPTKRYRIECKWHHNVGATLGAIELKVFDGDTNTQLGSTISVAADILTQHTRVLWGMENGTPEIGEFFMDDLALADDEAYIGAFVTNQPPSVTLNSSLANPNAGQSVTLTCTGSDPDGTIASYAFSQTAGPAVTLSGSGNTRTFSAPSVGGATTLTFQCVVTDNEGLTSTVTKSVTVNPAANVAPTASLAASDTTPDAGQTVTLTASATDTDGTISSYTFTQVSGPAVTLSGSGATRTFVAPYLTTDTAIVFNVTATDNGGATSPAASRTVTVNHHPYWAYPPSGGRKAILRQGPPPPGSKAPVVITGTIVPGNAVADLTYSVNHGDYNVTGVRFVRTPGSVTTNVSTLSGVQRFSGLTNGTAYTITATPLINNTPDPTFAQTYLVTPQSTGTPIPKVRAFGMYAGNYSTDAVRTAFGTRTVGGVVQKKDAEINTRYHQWGVPDANPASTPTNGIPPGNPYSDGTWYRDFKPIVWSTWSMAKEQTDADLGIWAALMFAPHSSSVIKWVGQGRAANSTGYDWAQTNIIDAWILKAKTIYDYDTKRPMYVFIASEPEAGANQGKYPNIPGTATPRPITDHVDAAKWMGAFQSLFISRARTLAPGMKVGIWLAGFRSDTYVNQMLTAVTVAPDIITGDPYVNDTANHSALDNFNDFTDQLRLTGQRWNTQYNRLSNLARPGVAANSGIPIPIGITEYGISKAGPSGDIRHTDAEMEDFISGAPAGWESIREAMVTADVEFSIYFDRDSGPQGKHRLDDGSHPLAVAAFRNELFRTDVTG